MTRLVTVDTPPPRVGWAAYGDPPNEPPDSWTVNFHWPLLRAIAKDFNHIDPAWWDDLPRIHVPTLVIGGARRVTWISTTWPTWPRCSLTVAS